MSKYRFKTEQEFKDNNQWDYDPGRNAPTGWFIHMIKQLGKPLDDSYNKKIESSKWFTHKGDGFIYSSNDVKLMENKEELLPIGTKVYIKDSSDWSNQGYRNHGKTKMIGEIVKIEPRDYDYAVKWEDGQTWLYHAYDLEPIEVKEEEINNELKQLFNQILNN